MANNFFIKDGKISPLQQAQYQEALEISKKTRERILSLSQIIDPNIKDSDLDEMGLNPITNFDIDAEYNIIRYDKSDEFELYTYASDYSKGIVIFCINVGGVFEKNYIELAQNIIPNEIPESIWENICIQILRKYQDKIAKIKAIKGIKLEIESKREGDYLSVKPEVINRAFSNLKQIPRAKKAKKD